MFNLLPALEDLAGYQKAARQGDIVSFFIFNFLMLTLLFSFVLFVGVALYFFKPEILEQITNYVLHFICGVKL